MWNCMKMGAKPKLTAKFIAELFNLDEINSFQPNFDYNFRDSVKWHQKNDVIRYITNERLV